MSSETPSGPLQLFISYSHQDERWLKRLQVFLATLKKDGLLRRWDDTEIVPGDLWKEKIKAAMAQADAAVLIVSQDFLASDFIADNELPPLLQAAAERGLLILPVIVSPCTFADSPLARFQSVNPPSRPLNKLSRAEQDEVLLKVAEAIKSALRNARPVASAPPAPQAPAEPDYLRQVGLEQTAMRLQSEFDKVRRGGRPSLRSAAIALDAYMEALELTRERLYVTTFLDSDFWGGKLSAGIVAANRRLSQRVRAAGGKARRIFIIGEPVDSYVSRKVTEALNRDDGGDPSLYKRLRDINESIENLAEYFEMKIIRLDKLPWVLEDLNPSQYELALYDSFRIDRFRVVNGSIIEVNVFPKNDPQFEDLLRSLERFFEEAWALDSELPVEKYPEMVRRRIEEELDQVRYTANWLQRFDYLVRSNDPLLQAEAAAVERYLRQHLERAGKATFPRYLDVGVCTGRYPHLLKEQREMVGSFDTIDRDEDSGIFLQIRYPDWNFVREDIRSPSAPPALNPPYDLITCMLGTVSHFGLSNRQLWGGRSGFFLGLKNILSMLRPGGLFLFSVWSQKAVEERTFLSVYTPAERRRLIDNNPRETRVLKTLQDVKEAGIEVQLADVLKTRDLDIYVVTRTA